MVQHYDMVFRIFLRATRMKIRVPGAPCRKTTVSRQPKKSPAGKFRGFGRTTPGRDRHASVTRKTVFLNHAVPHIQQSMQSPKFQCRDLRFNRSMQHTKHQGLSINLGRPVLDAPKKYNSKGHGQALFSVLIPLRRIDISVNPYVYRSVLM